jgi:hypothetical protein
VPVECFLVNLMDVLMLYQLGPCVVAFRACQGTSQLGQPKAWLPDLCRAVPLNATCGGSAMTSTQHNAHTVDCMLLGPLEHVLPGPTSAGSRSAHCADLLTAFCDICLGLSCRSVLRTSGGHCPSPL